MFNCTDVCTVLKTCHCQFMPLLPKIQEISSVLCKRHVLTPGRSRQRGKDQKPLVFVKISAPVTLLGEGEVAAQKHEHVSYGRRFGDSSVLSGQFRLNDVFAVCEWQLKSPSRAAASFHWD